MARVVRSKVFSLCLLAAALTPIHAMALPGTVSGLFLTNTVTVGSGPSAVAVGDVNKDGNLDIVVANYTDGTVSVILGNGDGTFQTQVTYKVISNPTSIALADLNNDGNLDIVVSDLTQIGILLGNGDGTFRAQTSFTATVGVSTSESFPSAFQVGDVNKDGKLDIVVLDDASAPNCPFCTVPQSVAVYLGNGDGTFQSPLYYSYGRLGQSSFGGKCINGANSDGFAVQFICLGSFALADMNGDGYPDLIFGAANSSSGGATLSGLGWGDLIVNYNDTHGGFSITSGTVIPETSGGLTPPGLTGCIGNVVAVAAAPLGGSGLDDVAGVSTDCNFDVYIRDANGNLIPGAVPSTQTGVLPTAAQYFGITLADTRGTGTLDLAAVNAVGDFVSVITGFSGDYTSTPSRIPTGGTFPLGIASGDFNGDHYDDLVTANFGFGGGTTITVMLSIQPPQIVAGSVSGPENSNIQGTLSATSSTGQPLTFAFNTPPTHGSVSIAASGAFVYTPDSGFSGSDSFIFNVSDGANAAVLGTENVTVNAAGGSGGGSTGGGGGASGGGGGGGGEFGLPLLAILGLIKALSSQRQPAQPI